MPVPVSKKSPPPPSRDVFGKIDVSKIGEGGSFIEGRFGDTKNLGLKGQLSALKRGGKYGSTKNLQDIYGMISDRLKKHISGSQTHVTIKDKKAIMGAAEKLIYTKGSNFSREDKKDLEKIVGSLRRSSRENILSKNRNLGTGSTPISRPGDLNNRPPLLRY